MGQLGIRIINVALFTLCCFLVAGIVNRIISDRLAPDYFAASQQEASNVPPPPSWEERKAILERNLFGASVAETAVARPQAEAPPPRLDEPVVETRLPLKLLGTMAAEPVHLSTAVIQNTRAKKHEVVAVGDAIPGHESVVVLAIEPRRVVLQNGGKREELVLEDSKQKGGPPDLAAATARARKSSASRAGRRASRSKRTAERRSQPKAQNALSRDANSADDELSRKAQEILSAARILPAYDEESGEMSGFSITALESGSVLERMGFQNDDVIHNVNGIEVDNPAATTRVFAELRSGSKLKVKLERAGESVDMSVSEAEIAEFLKEED